MTSTHLFFLALACIIGGVVVHIFASEGPIALMLTVAGTGAFGGSAMMARRESVKASTDAKERANEAFEETQTLRRDMMRRKD